MNGKCNIPAGNTTGGYQATPEILLSFAPVVLFKKSARILKHPTD